MVAVTLAVGAVVMAVLGFFTVSAVATLAHWITVAAALIIGGAVFYRGLQNDYLDFEGEVVAGLSYGVIGSVIGFVSYRVIEAAFAAFGLLAAFMTLALIGAGVVFGFGTVASAFATGLDLVLQLAGLIGGEQ